MKNLKQIQLITIILIISMLFTITGCISQTKNESSKIESVENSSNTIESSSQSSENKIESNLSSLFESSESNSISQNQSTSQISRSNGNSVNSTSKSTSTSSSGGVVVNKVNTYLNPALPKAPFQAKTLYVTGVPGFDDSLTLGTLQGLLATKGTEQIYITANTTYQLWLNEMKSSFGVSVVEGMSTWDLVTKFKTKLSGYILCKSEMGTYPGVTGNVNIDRSVNVATTLAKQLNAIVVTEINQAKAQSLGLSCILDVTGWDEVDLLSKPEYMSKLNKNLAVEQKPLFGANLRDYAVMSNSLLFFSLNAEQKRTEFIKTLNMGAALFGWGDPEKGEIGFVSEVSKVLSGYTIPSDHSFNLSTLSGFKLETVKQKTSITAKKENKHTVCFMMTDGDNIQWYLGGFNDRKWFGNANRGTFKMGWGIPPTLIDLAAPTLSWYMKNMTSNDGFVIQVGGLGYTYPSLQNKTYLKKQVEQLNDYMRRTDARIIEVVGNRSMNDTETWDIYTQQPNIDGLMYIDYNNYALYRGKIIWSNQKPIVSARYNLWKNENGTYLAPGGSGTEIAKQINSASTDPTSGDSYSLIDVHCWSMGMTDVKNAISLFGNNVRVVSPQEFMKLIKENVVPE